MILTQQTKHVSITPPAAIVDNTSFTTAAVDTKGWEYCSIYVYLGATDIALTALKVQESNDNGSSDSYADVTGLVYGTSANSTGSTSTLPSATDDNKFFAFHIDLRGRERYLDLVATIGDGTAGGFLTAWAVLSRGKEYPNSATERGLSQELLV